ncbi:uncharacterized protein LOC130779210 isoform X2 [Actinidia eriantha]|uniref:uncharacterized protein LOC130779210 isoform X2 n=1 Tax=Actinidia eriantha TaxID=165200 RepID=UPI0025879107|nr:uncharacterized protein LOC130779210 isoform X2 [Actinidia eriantha]
MFFRFLLCRTTFYIVRCSLKPVCVVACMDTTPLPAHMIDACLYIVQNGIINNLIQRALYILWTMEPIVVIAENSLISQKVLLRYITTLGFIWFLVCFVKHVPLCITSGLSIVLHPHILLNQFSFLSEAIRRSICANNNQLETINGEASENTPDFCIDAVYVGNVARFINHSCEPNLFFQGILSTHHDVGLAWVVLFAGESIAHFQLRLGTHFVWASGQGSK